jgi:hypothetical protein
LTHRAVIHDDERHGQASPLFAVAVASAAKQQYDVTADGQRFLVNSLVDERIRNPITVVLN